MLQWACYIPTDTQWNDNVIIKLKRLWYNNDVIITSRVRWDYMSHDPSEEQYSKISFPR